MLGIAVERRWATKVKPRVAATFSERPVFFVVAEEDCGEQMPSDPLNEVKEQDGEQGDQCQKRKADRSYKDGWDADWQ
ncbi:MAG: hypothetical protein CMJ47_06125 [Planctomyces sp.]|nr:hypothetical protein [Planctomyces sp.]